MMLAVKKNKITRHFVLSDLGIISLRQISLCTLYLPGTLYETIQEVAAAANQYSFTMW